MKISRNYFNKRHRINGGGEYPNGGREGRYSWGIRPSGGGGAISLGYSSPAGDIPRTSPPFERGANLVGGGNVL